MRYSQFEEILSAARMNRYLLATQSDSRKVMTLYRVNLKLSQEFFTIISCFEVALRNKIDKRCISAFGVGWLRDAAQSGGIFDNRRCSFTKDNINSAMNKLRGSYTQKRPHSRFGAVKYHHTKKVS